MGKPDLPLAEWIVLALIAERPSHGFAIAALTAEGAEIGEFWYISRPMVYRSITRLVERELITPVGAEEGNRGPQRMIYAATRSAKMAVSRWLSEPVVQLFDVRAELTSKLLLLHRRDASPARLVERQRVVIDEIEESLAAKENAGNYLTRAIYAWRLEHVRAARRFLDAVAVDSTRPAVKTG
ncbi:PadR family transcriptional regulator [Streptomyces noursei]|uniref:PadR family transcriptional regulator n=1 Tax=Streptomyces noursei TaxID=1971 RepID=A0A059W178_STRNR|nr:helix-turn-helix transcriptional regulator [Streptomyces noursei]AKA02007.1 PadR family transcriptional regulator [Streptomyces noursei ZPM]AIA01586.1 PadR-like family transcriptional regulator [Streptomyces noursei]MCZ0973743.1 helix-turn-helix transcriptional regulator [Streptomyces noursei]UWS70481.1 PadR family transcriptional regulator [Streptomyces noursei]GCB89200.1 PadR family transcriptional regulator [Streptomyces noursei]